MTLYFLAEFLILLEVENVCVLFCGFFFCTISLSASESLPSKRGLLQLVKQANKTLSNLFPLTTPHCLG